MQQVTVLPSYCVGEGVVTHAGALLKRLGAHALIIGGQKALAAAGPELIAALEKENIRLAGTEIFHGECTHSEMERLAEIAGKSGADFVIGVGGGKALDTAKGCASRLGLPVAAVPTIAATCAAVTRISVVYDEQHVFRECIFADSPPAIALIDTAILARAPEKYLLAGIGDALAKHIECTFASSGRELLHSCRMAVTLSGAIEGSLLQYGAQAIEGNKKGVANAALEEVALTNILTTGLVSLLIEERYNGGAAHALFYGLTSLPGFEETCLHGHAVGYGVLVQLALEGRKEQSERIKAFYRGIGMPTKLRDIGYELTPQVLDRIAPLAAFALKRDRSTPYPVTEDMFRRALLDTENAP